MAGELIPFSRAGELAELPRGDYWTSYDRESIESQIAMVRAVQGRDAGLDDMDGQEIVVQHAVCHWAQTVDQETGEIGESVRCVLVSPDGTRYATRSENVRRDIVRVAIMLGRPLPFSPPLRFRVRKLKNLAGNRKYLTLELIGEAATNGNGASPAELGPADSAAPQRSKKGRGTKPADPGA